ncbi:MAG: polyamine aminopropyltransferase [Planctomycetota bacterium]
MSAAIFLLSAAVLAHEVCLLRVLSLAYWHHAASLVVSVALLGFGVAGTLLALAPRLKRPFTIVICAALYAVAIPLSLRLANVVDFNILEAGWNRGQWLRLLAMEAFFLVPFLFAALAIAVALSLRSKEPGGIYAANLLGSGIGSLGAPMLLWDRSPEVSLQMVSILAAAAAVPAARGRWKLCGVIAAAAVVLLGARSVEMSPFKDLLTLPIRRMISSSDGPMGRVDRADIPALHHAPGLSITAGTYPESQEGLFLDGHLVGARDRGDLAYLDHTVGALPFVFFTERPKVLLLGVGPELGRANEVVEANRHLLEASGIYGWVDDPRAYLEKTEPEYDLIVHHIAERHAAAETPLLTESGLRLALARSHEGAVVSCALSTPPRAGLKLLATAGRVTSHLIAVRSADRLCVWLRHGPPDEEDKSRVLAFCNENGFDPVRPESWRFKEPHHLTETPLLPPGPGYPYDVRPATESRPYFHKYFRWSRMADLFDKERIPYVQWSYVALIVALVQVTLLAVLLLVGPLWASRAARAPAAMFLALGLGFMLLEMAFLQRVMVRLGSPVYAAAAVLGGFLIGSGLGSLSGERLGRPLRRAALCVVLLAPLGFLFMPRSLVPAALVCAVVAFPMGMPFPAALSRLEARSAPWALAWNGCASVAAAAAAPLVSTSFGIPLTCGVAILFYASVALFARPTR